MVHRWRFLRPAFPASRMHRAAHFRHTF